jgi:hypothetical protein
VGEHDDIQRSLSPLWIKVVQEERSYSHGQTKSPLQSVWPGLCLIPENFVITEKQRALIERLLLERISLRGICRAVSGGLQWLLQFMVEQFRAPPEHLYVESLGSTPAVIVQRLEAELDELWSFVGGKANRQ